MGTELVQENYLETLDSAGIENESPVHIIFRVVGGSRIELLVTGCNEEIKVDILDNKTIYELKGIIEQDEKCIYD